MEISNLAGLPAHPLIVHAVVVLVPLAAIGVLLSAVWPAAREKIGWISLGFATIGLLIVPLATSSGESLQERVPETGLVEDHVEMGNWLTPWVIVLFIAAVAVMGWALYRKRLAKQAAAAAGEASGSGVAVPATQPAWVKIVSALVIVLALVGSIGAVAATAMVGHSGAKATWEKYANTTENEGGGEGGESGGG